MISIRKTCVFDPSAFELMQLAPCAFKTRQIILLLYQFKIGLIRQRVSSLVVRAPR